MAQAKEEYGSVLVASGSSKSADALTAAAMELGCSHAAAVSCSSMGQRALLACDYDSVIINTPLTDQFGDVFAKEVCASGSISVILIVKVDADREIIKQVTDCGVLILEKPFTRKSLEQVLVLAKATRKRLEAMAQEQLKLQKRLDDVRITERAKLVLMQYLKMTEVQAHRYIEKQAMDMRITRREVAEDILGVYEA